MPLRWLESLYTPSVHKAHSEDRKLTVEALELALESFAQPCFACHVSAISYGMVKAWIETILHVFETFASPDVLDSDLQELSGWREHLKGVPTTASLPENVADDLPAEDPQDENVSTL